MDLDKDPNKLLRLIGILDDTHAEASDGVIDLPEQMNLILVLICFG